MKHLLTLAMLSPFCLSGQIRFNNLYDYNNQYQSALTVLEMQTGGYLVGSKNIGAEYSDNKLLLHRLDALGNEIWQKEIYKEGFIYYLDFGAMLRLPDGNFLLGGSIKELSTELNNAFLIKTDSSGNVLWEKTYGVSGKDDFFGNFALTPDSAHVVFCGQTRRTDAAGNIWLVKTDLEGNVIWDKEISASGWQHGNYMAMLGDGSFYVAVHFGTSGHFQYKVYKFDASGYAIWQKKVGTNNHDNTFPKVVALLDGSALFIGSVGTSNWQVNLAYAVKLSSEAGDIVWEKTYPTGFSSYAFAQPIVLGDGSVVLGGHVAFDNLSSALYARFWKINAEGEMLWERVHYNNPDVPNYAYHQIGTLDGGIVSVGSSHASATFQDIWMLKLDSEGCLVENCTVAAEEPEEDLANLQVWPNPATNWLTVKSEEDLLLGLRLSDLSGRVLEDVQFFWQHTVREHRLSLAALPPGAYVLSVRTDKGWASEKVVKN